MGGRERRGRSRPEGVNAQAAIGGDVLQRRVRIVLRDGAILVMVVLFLLPVHQGMGGFFHRSEGRGPARDRNDLPERREEEKNEDEPAAHPRSLAQRLERPAPDPQERRA